MDGCGGLQGAAPFSTCAHTLNTTDVSGPQVIIPEDPDKICNIDLKSCCARCDEDAKCKAFVWKKSEPHGIGCRKSSSYCWLLSGFSGTHAAIDGIFGAKGSVPP